MTSAQAPAPPVIPDGVLLLPVDSPYDGEEHASLALRSDARGRLIAEAYTGVAELVAARGVLQPWVGLSRADLVTVLEQAEADLLVIDPGSPGAVVLQPELHPQVVDADE